MDNQPSNFLQLPYSVRLQIYRELGFASRKIEISYYRPRPNWSERQQKIISVTHSFDRHFANQLFYVSRDVSEDARRVFWSENTFVLRYGQHRSFRPLLKAGPTAWSSMRDLHVEYGHRLCDALYGKCPCKDMIFNEKNGPFEESDVFCAWRELCVLLGRHVKHDQLSICIVCLGITPATAEPFLGVLRELPRLKDLSISLGPHRNLGVFPLVLETIKQKTTFFEASNRPPLQSFPTLDLPVELQSRILEFTGLTQSQPLVLRPPLHWFIPAGCDWDNCNSPAPGPSDRRVRQWCSLQYAAFSTVYPCWEYSDLRFVGNRHIRDLAIQVYYSTNTFNIRYPLPPPLEETIETWLDSSSQTSAIPWSPQTSGFLCGFPDYSWPHLRHIHFMFPDMHSNAFDVDYRGIRTDWLNSITIIHQRTTPGKLTIEIDLAPAHVERDEYDDPQNIARRCALYDQIVDPLACLGGHLKDLFIRCYFPIAGGVKVNRADREDVLERKVMGRDYNSLARGKQDIVPFNPRV